MLGNCQFPMQHRMTLLQRLTERVLYGFPLAHGLVNLLLVCQIKCNRPIELLMVKPERLCHRLGTMPFPLGVHNGVECHTGACDTVDSVVEFDIVSVHCSVLSSLAGLYAIGGQPSGNLP